MDFGIALNGEDARGRAGSLAYTAVHAVIPRLLAHNPAERHGDALEVLRELSAPTGLSLIEETAATRQSFLQAAALVGRGSELDVLVGARRVS